MALIGDLYFLKGGSKLVADKLKLIVLASEATAKATSEVSPAMPTPPAKKSTTAVSNTTSKNKFTYENAASNALGIVIQNQGGSHITRSD